MSDADLILAETTLDTPSGDFKISLHHETPYRIISATQGNFQTGTPIVRIQSSCIFSEVFHSKDCDCREQLDGSFDAISKNPAGGVILYSDQEGRGLGLQGKFRVHELERQGMDTVESYATLGKEPEFRDYKREIAALEDLNVSKTIILVSGNSQKRKALETAGYIVVETMNTSPNKEILNPMARREIETKEERLGYTYR